MSKRELLDYAEAEGIDPRLLDEPKALRVIARKAARQRSATPTGSDLPGQPENQAAAEQDKSGNV